MDPFKSLVESGVMTEETKSVIESAFAAKIKESREQVAADLREEFTQKYTHDKTVMAEAFDRLLRDRLTAELVELHEDRKALAAATVDYRTKVTSDTKRMETFVIQQLGKELLEFQADRTKVTNNVKKLENFVIKQLAKELREFQQDKKDLASTKVRLVREADTQLADIKRRFISQSAKVMESYIKTQLTGEIRQLKEDITRAKTNNFGQRIFESFAQEFNHSFFAKNSEVSRLLRILGEKDAALAETQMVLESKDSEIKTLSKRVRVTQDVMERSRALDQLMSPLPAEKRALMGKLLESVETPKLEKEYNRFLPSVLNKEASKSVHETTRQLNEGAYSAVTGNRQPSKNVGSDDEISNLRVLSGIAK